jgi:uncharacterized protein YndB with AHSA1/START domain
MSEFTVNKRIVIDAPATAVWDALTNPEKTKEYFFHCGVYSDWKVGSTITFKGHIFIIKEIEMTGKILEIEPGKLLKYQLKNSDGEAGTSIVTETLSEENGMTLLTISDDVGSEPGAKERFEKSEKGWDKVLTGLKKLVEEDK